MLCTTVDDGDGYGVVGDDDDGGDGDADDVCAFRYVMATRGLGVDEALALVGHVSCCCC